MRLASEITRSPAFPALESKTRLFSNLLATPASRPRLLFIVLPASPRLRVPASNPAWFLLPPALCPFLLHLLHLLQPTHMPFLTAETS